MDSVHIFFEIGIVVILLFTWKSEHKLRDLKKKGIYPTGTMVDVQKLVGLGYKIEAMKLYREIHDVGLKRAKEEIEKMVTKEK